MDKDTTSNKNKTALVITILFIVAFFVIFLIIKNRDIREEAIETSPDYLDTLMSIEARSFYVYDISEKEVVFAKDEHFQLPLASVTKLMSGLVIIDVLPETTIVSIDREDILQVGDSGLVVEEKWKLKDLLDFSLLSSSNDGIHALSRTLNAYKETDDYGIVKLMNSYAENLGLKDTTFINTTGLDIDGFVGGAYSSAYDVAVLFENILKNNPALISSTREPSEVFISENNIRHTALNTNTSINNIPGILASKTGFTDLAGGNLAIVFDAGFMHPVVVVVLGSTEKGRFSDVEKLVQITLEKLSY